MTDRSVYVVAYSLRSWHSGVDVYRTREAAEASIVEAAASLCGYDGKDVDAASSALVDHDHVFSLYRTEVRG